MQKDLVTLLDWPAEDIREVLDLADTLKRRAAAGNLEQSLQNCTLALIFEKSSMRTRVSFEVAMTQLGGASVYLSRQDVNLGRREPVKDGARVLARYVDGVAARTYRHSTVQELAAHADVPVINALSDMFHPCQALADVLTVREKFGGLDDVTLSYVGDCNNVARSLAVACAKLGVGLAVASPSNYRFAPDFEEKVRGLAADSGAELVVTDRPEAAVQGARAVYTDVWVSMGDEDEADARKRAFRDFQVNAALLEHAAEDAVVLHCLPAHRGEEITDEVIEGPRSAVFDQAENRLHAQRALLQGLMAG